jgi:hypothetical protein
MEGIPPSFSRGIQQRKGEWERKEEEMANGRGIGWEEERGRNGHIGRLEG